MTGRNNSVLTRVREANPNIYDLGCVCHLASLCTQNAIKTLPLPVDDLLTEVYFHFRHSSKRKEQYKDFLEFTDTEPSQILKHCQTRWLSLERCTGRLLHHWSALKSYFNSHPDVEKPGRVQRVAHWLDNPMMWLLYAFLQFSLQFMNEFNTTFQSGEAMIGHLVPEMNRLLRKLLGRFVTTVVIRQHSDLTTIDYQNMENQHENERLAVGLTAREYLSTEEVNPEVKDKFFSHVRMVYSKLVETMVAKFPFHDPVLQSIAFLNPDTRDYVSPEKVMSLSVSFLDDSKQVSQDVMTEYEEYLLHPTSDFI